MKVVATLLLMLAVSVPVMAAEIGNVLEDTRYGLGVDVVIARPNALAISELRADTRYDFDSEEFSAFLVAEVDLTQLGQTSA